MALRPLLLHRRLARPLVILALLGAAGAAPAETEIVRNGNRESYSFALVKKDGIHVSNDNRNWHLLSWRDLWFYNRIKCDFYNPVAEANELVRHAARVAVIEQEGMPIADLALALRYARSRSQPLGFLLLSRRSFGNRVVPSANGPDAFVTHAVLAWREVVTLVWMTQEDAHARIPAAVASALRGCVNPFDPTLVITDDTAQQVIAVLHCHGSASTMDGRAGAFNGSMHDLRLWAVRTYGRLSTQLRADPHLHPPPEVFGAEVMLPPLVPLPVPAASSVPLVLASSRPATGSAVASPPAGTDTAPVTEDP